MRSGHARDYCRHIEIHLSSVGVFARYWSIAAKILPPDIRGWTTNREICPPLPRWDLQLSSSRSAMRSRTWTPMVFNAAQGSLCYFSVSEISALRFSRKSSSVGTGHAPYWSMVRGRTLTGAMAPCGDR
jgi:hypothetical protein